MQQAISVLLRYFHTIRHLRFRQIVYQCYYRCCRSNPRLKDGWRVRQLKEKHTIYVANLRSVVAGQYFTLIGQTRRIDDDWNSYEVPKLWLYNLHYMDYLLLPDSQARLSTNSALIESWRLHNPPSIGNGWEPYCISLRVVNWIKWFNTLPSEAIKSEWHISLYHQGQVLAQRVEYHIGANHLFANAKAFLFLGAYFSDKQAEQWLNLGLKIINQEIVEQFLDDGAHFERSPMYHAIAMWDLCDLLCLFNAYKLEEFDELSSLIENRIVKGMLWLKSMIHPDGDLAFFNDTALNIAPTYEDLHRYTKSLGLEIQRDGETSSSHQAKSCNLALNEASGFAAFDWQNAKALLNFADIKPSYQPGHAHADTLSFELSILGQRVFVNSGISTYDNCEMRHNQRATSSHNTVVLKNENSSDVWASFRVGKRAKATLESYGNREAQAYVHASHNGYSSLYGKITHSRRWQALDSHLRIEDELSRNVEQAVAVFHLHPDIEIIDIQHHEIICGLPTGQQLNISFNNGAIRIIDSFWYPQFNSAIPNKLIEVAFDGRTLTTDIDWGNV